MGVAAQNKIHTPDLAGITKIESFRSVVQHDFQSVGIAEIVQEDICFIFFLFYRQIGQFDHAAQPQRLAMDVYINISVIEQYGAGAFDLL